MPIHGSTITPVVSLLIAGLLLAAPSVRLQSSGTHGGLAATIETHDNIRPAGELSGSELRLSLRAGRGEWSPSGEHGPSYETDAFGAGDGPLQVPAPLIRVRQGTTIAVSVRNDLDDPLRVHGLCARDGSACAPLDVPPGEVRDVRFAAAAAGTYHYWGTSTGMPLQFRALDGQLSGALIVDPAEGPGSDDRVLVITEWASLTRSQFMALLPLPDPGPAFLALKPTVFFAVNGRVWPYNERFAYDRGASVRWRVVNLSTEAHPMHLHGFYFEPVSLGNGLRDDAVAANRRQPVVTQLMPPGGTMTMQWTPEREGNWLFHCHTMVHVSPTLYPDGSPREDHGNGHGDHAGAGMQGLVLGVTVRGPRDRRGGTKTPAGALVRRLTMRMDSESRRFGDAPAFGFQLSEGVDVPPPGPVPVPGPPLVLTRGEPVEITLVNRLPEATSIHWHGMELDSYYDGVHGWSGKGRHLSPLVEPGATFVVRFTPPRAGTFMYHTHLHDNRQLTSGLYGAMLVVEPGASFDERVDHVFVIGRGGPAPDAPVVINGDTAPQLVWSAGVRHRIRLINITPGDLVSVGLRTSGGPVNWRPVAKDGAAIPADRSTEAPAAMVFGAGETYDFEYDAPEGRQTLWLEVRKPGGKWLSQGHVIVR